MSARETSQVAGGARTTAPDPDRFQARGATPRLVWLHMVSRQVPPAAAILLGCALVLALGLRLNWIQGDGVLVQEVPVMLQAAVGAVVAVSTRSPFGESELANGRLLPYLRLAAVVGLTVVGIGLFAAGAVGGDLPGGTLVSGRSVLGMTGLGLICAAYLGGALAWIGPVAYAAVTEYALTASWQTPWIWSARPAHDWGASLCALLVFVVGLGLVVLRGPRIVARDE